MRIIVTGGAGFIGSNFIRYILSKYPSYHVLNYDKLTYAGNVNNLKDFQDNINYKFICGDICDKELISRVAEQYDVIINFAAETHVDRSIHDPFAFIKTNVEGTCSLISAARSAEHMKFIQISTDEVYGDFDGKGKADENSQICPSSPYAASKAAGDLQVMAAVRTYEFPGIITRCTNNYGSYEHPEKFIPLLIMRAINDQDLPLYGDGQQIRDWLHVKDHCEAIDVVLHKGEVKNIYNIAAEQENEIRNIDVVKALLDLLRKDDNLIKFVKDRPGHDKRYAVDSSKIRKLGWTPTIPFQNGLTQTLQWYQRHRDWLSGIEKGEFQDWIKKQYNS